MLTFQRGFDITKNQQQYGPYKVISSSGPQSTKVKGPGLVIGRKGTLGSIFYTKEPFWPHDTTLWVKDFHGNDPKFAYYFLKTLHLERYDAGSSNPSLNRNHIHLIPVEYPAFPNQLKIASVLSTYDDLIENNEKRIKALEEMAQLLYTEWFVKFKFPSNSVETQNFASVRMVDSGTEYGMIPEGWGVKRLGKIAYLIMGAITNIKLL